MEVYSSAFFRPNTLFLPVTADSDEEELQVILDQATKNHLGVILYVDNPLTALGREQVLNVWLREQSPEWEVGLQLSNLDLALLLAYQLARNWKAQVNLITVVQDPGRRGQRRGFSGSTDRVGPHATQYTGCRQRRRTRPVSAPCAAGRSQYLWPATGGKPEIHAAHGRGDQFHLYLCARFR